MPYKRRMKIILPDTPVTIEVDGVRRQVAVNVVNSAPAVWAMASINPSRSNGIQLSRNFTSFEEAVRVATTEGFDVIDAGFQQVAEVVNALRTANDVRVIP